MTSSPSLEIRTRSGTYPIHFGSTASEALGSKVDAMRRDSIRHAVITDANVFYAQPSLFAMLDEEPLILPAGEQTKSAEHLEHAWAFLTERGISRSGCIFAVGGGVIGDLVGFAAASHLRGVTYFQVPTTLLAMVDSSVGGKTGINTRHGKNLAGAFWQPGAVYIMSSTLQTLPVTEFAAGMAEVIKYGLLADSALLRLLEERGSPLHPADPDLSGVIRRCCEIKGEIVGDDERETAANDGRALLNLGHTFAHAIENVSGYGSYLHGEAVAVGLVLATRLSENLGHLPNGSDRRVEQLLQQYQLPTRLREPLPVAELMDAMLRDKKVRSGGVRFVALKEFGKAITVDSVDDALIRALWFDAGACNH